MAGCSFGSVRIVRLLLGSRIHWQLLGSTFFLHGAETDSASCLTWLAMLALKDVTEEDLRLDSDAIFTSDAGLFLSLVGSNVWLMRIWLHDFGSELLGVHYIVSGS